MKFPLSVPAVVLGLGLGYLTSGKAIAASFSFTKIADTNDGFTSFFTSPSINNDGTVAFSASQGAGSTGVFTGNGGATTTIATSNGANPGFVSVASDPSINDSGTVAFKANTSTNNTGIFTGSGTPGSLTTIAANNINTEINPVINNSGTVVFSAFNVPPSSPSQLIGPSILSSNGGQLTTVVPGGPDSPEYRDIAINNLGTVAYAVSSNGGFNGGSVSTVSSSGGPITTTNYGRADNTVSINNLRTVAGRAIETAGSSEIFTVNSSGGITTIARGNIFAGVGFQQVGSTSINDKGEVVFTASLAGSPGGLPVGYGLFTGPDPVADKVIATGDSLLGSTVTNFGFPSGVFFGGFSNRGLNNSGEIAFYARLADGTSGIFRAEPVPEPDTAMLNLLASAAIGAGVLLKRQHKQFK